jgi:hypothetical protein
MKVLDMGVALQSDHLCADIAKHISVCEGLKIGVIIDAFVALSKETHAVCITTFPDALICYWNLQLTMLFREQMKLII